MPSPGPRLVVETTESLVVKATIPVRLTVEPATTCRSEPA